MRDPDPRDEMLICARALHELAVLVSGDYGFMSAEGMGALLHIISDKLEPSAELLQNYHAQKVRHEPA